MLELKNFSVSADSKPILENLNLEFGPGFHFVLGPNGAGKSTLAHSILANPKYTVTGDLIYNNENINDVPTHLRAQEGIFLSFQNPTPIEGLSNFQMIRQMLQHRIGFKLQDALHGFRGLAEEFNLPRNWDKEQLNVFASGGEKKKNELIQMIMSDPSVVILDEPDSGLDIDSINLLIDRLKFFTRNNDRCVIIISHYEKLLRSFTPNSVTIVSDKKATQHFTNDIVDKIFKEGFKQYAS